MITAEGIKSANQRISRVEIKGKDYACVPARVQAFREMCPDGTITTEIIMMEGEVVVMKATIMDETGRVLATGLAREKESSSYINKTSYIENCETSAVGRALGMIGLGSEDSMASAEEVTNAINNQGEKPVEKKPVKKEAPKKEAPKAEAPAVTSADANQVTDVHIKTILAECDRTGVAVQKILRVTSQAFGRVIQEPRELNMREFTWIMDNFSKTPSKGA